MRKLVAALACRTGSTRLYAKPAQFLDVEYTVTLLGHLIRLLQSESAIGEVVLGVAEGSSNEVFHEIARSENIVSIRGSEADVLKRLIHCGEAVGGTDIFRVTTESPFIYFDPISKAWEHHVSNNNDATVTDCLPEGTHFEIFTLEALNRSWAAGGMASEFCNRYICTNPSEFKIEVIPVPEHLLRMDIRLTVDYPEDLVLCRRVYEHLKSYAPRIPLAEIIKFLDARPDLGALVEPYLTNTNVYGGQSGRK